MKNLRRDFSSQESVDKLAKLPTQMKSPSSNSHSVSSTTFDHNGNDGGNALEPTKSSDRKYANNNAAESNGYNDRNKFEKTNNKQVNNTSEQNGNTFEKRQSEQSADRRSNSNNADRNANLGATKPSQVNMEKVQNQFIYPKPENQPGFDEPFKMPVNSGSKPVAKNFVRHNVPHNEAEVTQKPICQPIEKKVVDQAPAQKAKGIQALPEPVDTQQKTSINDRLTTLQVPKKPAIVNEKPQPPWKSVAPFDTNSPATVVVQFVEENNPEMLWVMLQSNENDSNNLLVEINREIKHSTPQCSPDELKINNVVGALFEGIYYRAIILDTLGSLNEVLLRLVDYGNEEYVKLENIKSPTPAMFNAHQFAFQVKFLNKKPIEIGATITIRFLSREPTGLWIVTDNLENGGVEVTAKIDYPIRSDISTVALPEKVPLELVMLDTSLFMTDRTITAAVYDTKLLLEMNKLGEKFTAHCIANASKTPPHMPKVGEICSAIFEEDGYWYRTECINVMSDTVFLLKFIDYGNYSEVNVNNIRKMSREYLYQTLANVCSIDTGKFKKKYLMPFIRQTNHVSFQTFCPSSSNSIW